MTYRAVSQERPEAERLALTWLEEQLRYESWLECAREPAGPYHRTGLAAAA